MQQPSEFTYSDTDSFANEISELYSYGEESELLANKTAFEESMEDCGLPLNWKHMVPEQQSRAINNLMSTLEVSCRASRMKSCKALAYIVQGNFDECLTIEEQIIISQQNVFLLYEQGIFQAFIQQLLIESDLTNNSANSNISRIDSQYQPNHQLSAQLFNDSAELRLILSVLYTITETMYQAKDSTDQRQKDLRQQFIVELQNPIGDDFLSITLFQMLNNFCSGSAPHYPVKKITLLIWKIILITLGGTEKLKQLKEVKRKEFNLGPVPDDTLDVTKNMAPSLLNVNVGDQMTGYCRSVVANHNKKPKVFKQPAFDDAVFAYAKECLLNSLAELNQPENEIENETEPEPEVEADPGLDTDGERPKFEDEDIKQLNDTLECIEALSDEASNLKIEEEEDPEKQMQRQIHEELFGRDDNEETDDADSGATSDADKSQDSAETVNDVWGNDDTLEDDPMMNSIEASSSRRLGNFSEKLHRSHSDVTSIYKGLPWAPKVRKADLIAHIANLRQKFFGYTLPNDLDTLLGLPNPIIEGISVLRKHMYTTLSEIQLDREDAMEKWPLTFSELDPNFNEAPAEKLYSALLPRLPQYMIALLKILLAASTNTKNRPERSESINIMGELNPENNGSIVQAIKVNADGCRHKEIIIKSVSSTLLLLLKHFKINHIYQFEYVSQQLMFANCIPLILKFLSQDIYNYIYNSGSNITVFDFPACVIGEQPELTTDAIVHCSSPRYSWRNMLSCINLVRILNKLTKWKHSRIMMLVVFKSAPTLVKTLSIRNSMFQLYILKLLKVQLKFLGRQWKKNNMQLISAIYQKVRHRLTDDWAYSNDIEARPWDFQAEEFTLQANINKFHQRRYFNLLNPSSNRNCISSVFNNHMEQFGGGFEQNFTDEDYDFGREDYSQISQLEKNYERWLESEVFQRNIDWNKLL